jgi:hypothetical protein
MNFITEAVGLWSTVLWIGLLFKEKSRRRPVLEVNAVNA